MSALPVCSGIFEKAGGCCFENELLWRSLIIWLSAKQTGITAATATGNRSVCFCFCFMGAITLLTVQRRRGNKENGRFTSDVSLWRKNTKINLLRPQCLFYKLESLFKENSLWALSVFMLWVYEDSRFALKVILITLVISVSNWRLGSLLIRGSQVTLACHFAENSPSPK